MPIDEDILNGIDMSDMGQVETSGANVLGSPTPLVPPSADTAIQLTDENLSLMRQNDPNSFAADQLRESLTAASKTQPEVEAQVREASIVGNIPTIVARGNLAEIQRQQKLDAIDLDDMVVKYPKTARHFAVPENAATSIDDMEAYQWIEDAGRDNLFVSMFKSFASRGLTIAGNALQFTGELSEDLEKLARERGLPNAGLMLTEDGPKWSWDMPEGTQPAFKLAGARLSDSANDITGYTPYFTQDKMFEDKSVGSTLGFVAENAPAVIGDALTAGFAPWAYFPALIEEYAEQRVANIDDKDDADVRDLLAAAPIAVGSFLLDKLFFMKALQPAAATGVLSAGKQGLKGAATGGATEFGDTVLEHLGTRVGTDTELSLGEWAKDAVGGTILGASVGGATASTGSVVSAATMKRKERDITEVMGQLSSLAQLDQLDEVAALAQNTNGIGRSPEQLRAFLKDAVGEAVIHIDPDDILQAQENGIEIPSSILSKIDGTGAEIEIDAADLVMNAELMGAVRQSIRIDEGSTRAELGSTDRIKAIIAEAGKESSERDASQQYADNLVEKLVKTGRMNKRNAKLSSAMFVAYAETLAARTGLPVQQVFDDIALDIVGPDKKIIKTEADLNNEATKPMYEPTQNLEGIELEEQGTVKETGDTVTINQSAQKVWDQTQKKRNMAAKLVECLNG